ncbi:MAG: ATP-binding cassette domain-containing protein [Xanthobacteraceae bacterium]|nr:ATP-binding cassette domain-containing protein [Xanthobacteraceae bacterium]
MPPESDDKEGPKVELDRVAVDYPVFDVNSASFKNLILRAGIGGLIQLGDGGATVVRALDEVSFSLRKGSRIALMGHNGAGKTTLLQIVAGIHQPTCGTIKRIGRVGALLNVGLGINEEKTGLENIILKSTILGLSKQMIERLTPEISEFTELGPFLQMPVRTYSAGMRLRLSFAIATAIAPDILVVDEWIEFADQSFARKAEARMLDLVKRSGILVVASHSERLLNNICNRAIILDKGRIIYDGDTGPALARYERLDL